MKKLIRNILLIGGLGLTCTIASCSDNIADEIKEVNYERLFSPIEFSAKIRNNTNVLLTWTEIKNVTTYKVEIYKDDENMAFTGTPSKTLTLTGGDYEGLTEKTYTIKQLNGSTYYSIRIKAVNDEGKESKWIGAVVKTNDENYMQGYENLSATGITIAWDGSVTLSKLCLFKASDTENAVETITDATTLVSGSFTFSELDAETEYVAKIYRSVDGEEKSCGTIKFKTEVDLGGATPVYATADMTADDIKQIFDNAAEGEKIAFLPSEDGTVNSFPTATISLTKSVIITALTSKPISADFAFTIEGGGDITIENMNFKAEEDRGFFKILHPNADANYTLQNCTLTGYKQAFADDSGGTETVLGNLLINNCIFDNITGRLLDFQKKISFKEVKLTNSTIKNVKGDATIRFDYIAGRAGAYYLIQNNTFYDISPSAGIAYIRSNNKDKTDFSCQIVKNLFHTSDSGLFSKDTKTNGITFDTNFYYNFTASASEKVSDSEGKILNADPCTDVANGDFTLKEGDVNDAQAGAPNWFHK